jgi:membrane protease YdiL (CAAX protease family)
VGTILTVARAKTKSVAVSVLIHMAYNSTLFTLLYIATQGFRHMESG